MRRLFTLLLYFILLLVSLGASALSGMNYLTLTHGVESDFPAAPKILGTNVTLEQYTTDEDLQRAFDVLKRAHISIVRQYFSWREIESQRGVYAWAQWDRIVNAAHANGIQLVAVLDTAPVWTQRVNERDIPNAPPNDFAEFTRFAGDFSKRYGDTLQFYQIWDEPNVEPNWGRRNADPVEYARLLIPAAQVIRANDADAQILLAGLAMNTEVHRPHPNYSEILFLRGLYEIGANKYFDIVAAKPYGMWTGPEDRTVNSDVLNFSRLTLLRDEMVHYGDRAKPVWAVEMGWNALPANWSGEASPWGTDTEEKQADRLARGLQRAQNEWNWLAGEFPLVLQPHVSPDNPRWGFALVTRDFQTRTLYDVLAQVISAPPPTLPPPAAPVFPIALLIGTALVSAWRVWHWTFSLRLDEHWRGLKTRVHALPEWFQVLGVIGTALAFYVSPSAPLNFILLAVLVLVFALRLDVGIGITIFAIPFWNFPKILFGGFELSPVEAFTWSAAAAFLLETFLSQIANRKSQIADRLSPITDRKSLIANRPSQIANPSPTSDQPTNRPTDQPTIQHPTSNLQSPVTPSPLHLFTSLHALSSLDRAALAFLILGLLSTHWAGNFGVASREFRIILLDPILLYVILRLTPNPSPEETMRNKFRPFFRRGGRREVYALLASGVAVCVIGLYQYFSGDVILADGVARLTAVWGSPNNVGLYLGRLLPMALAFFLLFRREPVGAVPCARPARERNFVRWVYAGLVVLFAVTIWLTYSRGALFLGVPASVLFLFVVLYTQSHRLSRRAWLGIGAAVFVAALALIPFLSSERFLSFFQAGTGTGFFRVAVWTSAVNMIRDHPLLGVGLDNFLYEYPKYILPAAWAEPNLSHPHDFILDFWVRLGIGGLAIFGWMLVAFYKRAWHSFKTTTDLYTRALMLGLMASVVNMLAHGLIDAAYFVVDLAYVFVLTLALCQVADDRQRTTDDGGLTADGGQRTTDNG